MNASISVITCTHNPRKDFLDRVIYSLKSQTLPTESWEYLLVDNASKQPLKSEIDLSWHPNARHIIENNLGLTPARLRGISESLANVLVFVDDDNVLESDYLEKALQVSNDYPFVGAWGGQIIGEYEVPPPEWAKPYLPKLGIREFAEIRWSNLVHQYETTPCGAGICVRKTVAQEYARLVNGSAERLKLDRTGQMLTSGGDSDLAFTACDMGFGTGLFPSLRLTHLIPANRLEKQYLLKLIEGMNYSHRILDSFRGRYPQLPKTTWKSKIKEFYYLRRIPKIKRDFYLAQKRGFNRAVKLLYENTHKHQENARL